MDHFLQGRRAGSIPAGRIPAATGARVAWPYVAVALIAGLALAMTARHMIDRAFAVAIPTSIVISALADFSTLAVLVHIARRSPDATAKLLLAAFYAESGVCAIGLLLCIRLLPGEAALLPVSEQTSSWLLVGWQALSALYAFAYVIVRDPQLGVPCEARRRNLVAFAIVTGIAVGALVACGGTGHVPPILDGVHYTIWYRIALAPSLVACCAAGSAALALLRPASRIDRAFAFGLFNVAAGIVLSAVGGARYTMAWYAAGILYAGAAVYVLAAAIRALLETREQLIDTEAALSDSERESARNAERLRSLWTIGANLTGADDERLAAVLDAGVRMIRPDRHVFGYLSHLQQGSVVIDAVSDHDDPAADMLRPGASIGLERLLQSVLYADGRTCAWNNLHAFDDLDLVCREIGWRAVIGTPVQIGRKTHFLVFGSQHAMDDAPFAEDDIAFVDVLAAFVAHRFSEAEQRERIQFQMEHDALTGMKNRTQFRLALRADIAEGRPFALAYLDLDRFRAINEMAGNMVGDEVLVEVAAGLSAIDPRDFVARTSGDGFAIIMRDAASAHDAEVRLSRYADLFARPFHTGDRDGTRMLALTASFGAARFPADGRTVDDLLRSADVALDVAKGRGGACVAFFDRGMSANLEQRYLQTIELSEAIEQGELSLRYQPTFALATTCITGAEALVRWEHPTRGLISPADFVPFAERNGLIGRLSRWVFERTVTDLMRLPALPEGFRCFFNLSTQQLDDVGFITEIEERLRYLPRIARHLGVEITETAAITNTEKSMFALERFRKLGMRIAIDDFGTGYSSLSYLKRLPVDVLKIDRSFVSGLPADEKDADLCELLLQIAKRFGLVPLAEGIESTEQLQWLRDHGCTSGQGYLIAKPLPFADFAARLARPLAPAS